jgi:DNA-binding NtrC family response regulator
MSTTPNRPARDSRGESGASEGVPRPAVARPSPGPGPLGAGRGAADALADWRGPSPALEAFREALSRVGKGDATVLLGGESGTGKSRAAALLHHMGPRSAGPLVEVHLGALGTTLIESELFGHEAGAFTDARRARLGRFRQADGGTLVLDDVDLLPAASQVKLLRVLQERRVEPVGAEKDVPVDVRIVATTARDLAAEAAAGRFRQDLYWRLAVVPLEVPPLRARVEDLPGLVEVLLERTAARLGRPAKKLSP